MNSATAIALPEALSENQRAALLNLLADEDRAIYQTVRQKILSYGPQATEWLRPHVLSSDPALRRRAQEIVLHFERQAADTRFLGFCLKHGEDFDLEQGAWLLAQTRHPEINRELLVLSLGFGSVILSHLNDGGFWIVKECLGLTVGQTLRTWTVVETIISVTGLGFTLLLAQII